MAIKLTSEQILEKVQDIPTISHFVETIDDEKQSLKVLRELHE